MKPQYTTNLTPLSGCGGLSNKTPSEDTGIYGLHRDWYDDGTEAHRPQPGIIYQHLVEWSTVLDGYPPVQRVLPRAPSGYERPGVRPGDPVFGMQLGHWHNLTDAQQEVMKDDLKQFLRENPGVKVGPYVLGWGSDPMTKHRAREFPLDGRNALHWRWFSTEMLPWMDAGCQCVGLDHACFNYRPDTAHHPGDWRYARDGMAALCQRAEAEWGIEVLIEGLAVEGETVPSPPDWDYLRSVRSIVMHSNMYQRFLRFTPNAALERQFLVPKGVEVHVTFQASPPEPAITAEHVQLLRDLGYVISWFDRPFSLPGWTP